MNNSTSLLNQGNGYIKMKKLRRKEQEKTILMKENKIDENENTSLKEGFVESMDNKANMPFEKVNANSLSNLSNEENKEFNKLRLKFDRVLSSYTDIQKSITQISHDYINEDKNKLQKNIYAQTPPTYEGEPQKQGCYIDRRYSRALPLYGGTKMSKMECAQLATEMGKPVFGLQNGQGEKSATCFVGDSLQEATKYGESQYRRWHWQLRGKSGFEPGSYNYSWRQYREYCYWCWNNWKTAWYWARGYSHWQIYTQSVQSNNELCLRISTQSQLILSEKEHGGKTIWNSGNEIQEPEIDWKEKPDFDFGGNDITNYSNVSLDFCHDKCAKDDSCVVHNYNDKAQKCYIKRGFSNGYNSSSWNSYIKQAKPANAYLIIQDDGECALYKGSGPSDNQGKLFSFNTGNNTSNQLTKNDGWLNSRKYGRNYIKSDEMLKKGERIVSDNGFHGLFLTSQGNILVGSNYSQCKTYNNEKVGGWDANSIYTIPKSDVRNLGNAFYQNETGNNFQYPQTAIKNNVTYKLAKAGYDSTGNSIGSAWINNIEQAKSACNANPNAHGFVYLRYSEYPGVGTNKDLVIFKNNNMWPKTIASKNSYCDIYIRDKKLDNNYSCDSQINSNVSSDKFTELTGGGKPKITYDIKEKTTIVADSPSNYSVLEDMSSSECEEHCTNSKDCISYLYKRDNSKTCIINNEPMKSSRNYNMTQFDTYIKKQATVSGMDGMMDKNKNCSIKAASSQERNILEKKKANLMNVMEEILNKMKGLYGKAKQYNNKTNDIANSGINIVYEYEQIMNKIKQEKQNLKTLVQQDEDSEYITTAENYKYISYSIIAIMLMIFTFKFIKKKS